jgi:hypothetical protein
VILPRYSVHWRIESLFLVQFSALGAHFDVLGYALSQGVDHRRSSVDARAGNTVGLQSAVRFEVSLLIKRVGAEFLSNTTTQSI